MNYMKEAVKEAFDGLEHKDGGPFGAVVVRNGEIISRGHNLVVSTNDPTAHAEIVAIRRAASKLGRFDLSDCEIYSSCEPCPMCFSAIHWARIPVLYYGATREDAASIGFDDELLYKILNGEATEETLVKKQIERDTCLEPFDRFANTSDKTMY